MDYLTRDLVALRDIPHAGRYLTKGERFVATQVDADYYVSQKMAASAPPAAAPAAPAAPAPAPIEPPAPAAAQDQEQSAQTADQPTAPAEETAPAAVVRRRVRQSSADAHQRDAAPE